MMRLAVKFSYLGEGFSGSQVQPGLRTVEGEMLSALGQICDMGEEELDLRIASRTDRGVNALGNVAVFNTGFEDPCDLLRALNAVSDGVFYRSFAVVNGDFNPRHASRRTYRYIIPSRGLDVDAARACAGLFVGEHDFARFCRPDGKPTVVTVDSIDVEESGEVIIMTYRARFFLWNMVRRTAAAVIAVASGRSTLRDVSDALDGAGINFGVARADALTLTDVEYEGVEFTDSPSPVLAAKAREGLFASELDASFYRSLF